MEAEVLKALLVAKIPTILFVMNRFTDVNNLQIEQALQEDRMLIVILKRDEPRGKGTTPRLRNEYVLSLCQHIVCGYVNKNGSVFPMLAGREDVTQLIDNNTCQMAEEPKLRHVRWTVAQDKVLLRMYYADMGIHAIHKRLQRSYVTIHLRIRSITQPEDVLKGREFEDYVLSLFNPHDNGPLILQEWQGDKSLGLIRPRNNSNPDFVFRHDEKEFAVECKWRERLDNDIEKNVFPKTSIEKYKAFSATRKIPVTIILGIGGEPCNPEWLYAIPLGDVPTVVSHPSLLTAFSCTSQSLDISLFMPTEKQPKKNANTIEEKRKLYPNAYKPWSKEDDERLWFLYEKGGNVKELSLFFKRNEGAIRSRINKIIMDKSICNQDH